MAVVLVTGANRGIGFELCRQFAARGDEVIAVCREPGPELESLGVEIIQGVDVGSNEAGQHLTAALSGRHIDILVNNAGILRGDRFGELDYDEMVEQFQVNALGPLRVTEALSDNLGKGSKVAIVTSRVGSIADNSSGGNWGYRASKAAVNMIGTNLKHEFAGRGIAVALLHPGYVATDMTGGQGQTVPEKSARGLIERIDALTMATSGGFWHAEGYELPW